MYVFNTRTVYGDTPEFFASGAFGGGGGAVGQDVSPAGGGGGGYSGGGPGCGGGSYGSFTPASVSNLYDGYVIAKLDPPTAPHVLDLLVSFADVGATGGWAPSGTPPSDILYNGVTYKSGATPTAVSSITVIARLVDRALFTNGLAANVFSLDGVSLTIFTGVVQATPMLTVTGMGVVINQNTGCNFAFYLDGSNGPPGSATFLPLVHQNELLASIVVSFDATGVPSATDGSGKPFAAVPFPAGKGGNTCAPASIGANAMLYVGSETAVAYIFPGAVLYLGVA